MTLFVLYSGFGLFAFGLALHILIWRFGRVRHEMFWLFLLLLGVPAVLLAWLYAGGHISPRETLAVGLLWSALTAAYIQTYPVLRHVIPTFRILLLLHRHGSLGLTEEEIMQQLAEEGLFRSGLNDLENDSLVIRMGERYAVTRGGALLARAFSLYRRALGVSVGTG